MLEKFEILKELEEKDIVLVLEIINSKYKEHSFIKNINQQDGLAVDRDRNLAISSGQNLTHSK